MGHSIRSYKDDIRRIIWKDGIKEGNNPVVENVVSLDGSKDDEHVNSVRIWEDHLKAKYSLVTDSEPVP